jgi:hypothetical protein
MALARLSCSEYLRLGEVKRLFSTAKGTGLPYRERTMKAKRFSEEQIIGVLKEAEAGAKTMDLCRKRAGAALRNLGMRCPVLLITGFKGEPAKVCIT